eukprot:TRINITY_DN9064_c0_g1_i3.p1 TRINITY_DN9064_c0_g1~~TRINITY_DN9064_c0_g1_i3.p1  ORF type:complete len:103 (+),score=20.09 TRINITY_DN9064_c0_g1_i3:66-374(+)
MCIRDRYSISFDKTNLDDRFAIVYSRPRLETDCWVFVGGSSYSRDISCWIEVQHYKKLIEAQGDAREGRYFRQKQLLLDQLRKHQEKVQKEINTHFNQGFNK